MIRDWKEIIDFWFDPKHIPLQFAESDAFDQRIRELFLETWQAGAEGLLVYWRETIRGRLAEIIVLDQFSRNLWRRNIKTYTQDKMAIALAQEALAHPDYEKLTAAEKKFILLPFMHSESVALHDWARPYYEAVGDEELLYFENMHYAVLKEFGRYPYQNEDLGRESTPKEISVLKEKMGRFYRPKEK